MIETEMNLTEMSIAFILDVWSFSMKAWNSNWLRLLNFIKNMK